MGDPEVQYTWNGDIALAYEVFGSGPVDLVYLQGFASQLDVNWRSPYLAAFLRGLGSTARVVAMDRRGWGLSERFTPGDVAALEVQVDDLVAVMAAAGTERAVILASVETVPATLLFAATYPERVIGLVLVDPFISFYDTPEARAMWAQSNADARGLWGRPGWMADVWRTEDPEYAWFLELCRASVAPGALTAESDRFAGIDVRPILSSVLAPTVVIGRDAPPLRSRHWQDLAAGVPGAILEVPEHVDGVGVFHWYQRSEAVLSAVRRLVRDAEVEAQSFDRVLATVMFSDIVSSTETLVSLGDVGWRELIEAHHRIVRGMLSRYRGVEVDTAGDGFFATFDGPARAVRCAQSIVEAVASLGISVRIGIHTGEVETINGKVGGRAVHLGARISAVARPSEVLVSSTVRELTLGSGMEFIDVGQHELKGMDEPWHLYSAVRTP